jgi:hypothetical protein
VTYLLLSHSLSHISALLYIVWERRHWGDLEVWPRILRSEGQFLVVSIQRFRIPLSDSISNPLHHESRYKINAITRSPYLGLLFSISRVDQLHLHPSCCSMWWIWASMVDFPKHELGFLCRTRNFRVSQSGSSELCRDPLFHGHSQDKSCLKFME